MEPVDTSDIGDAPKHCECDNTHKANNTVCRFCWACGRRQWADPDASAIQQLPVVFAESFLKPDIHFGGYFTVETTAGTELVPGYVTTRTMTTIAEYFADYVEGKLTDPEAEAEYKEGWLARLSARGFLDCTDWTAHKSEEEAAQYLIDQYGDD